MVIKNYANIRSMFPVLSGVTFWNAYLILKFIANGFGSLEEELL